jgi:hypothetical protein
MKNYPETIPIFPLSGVIYFPKTNLPLNIFEERYLNLVNEAYDKNKLMGMVQSKKGNNSVYKIGCLGKISDYQKSKDGRVFINLTGVTRFEILEEIDNNKLYREFKVNYRKFEEDLFVTSYEVKTDSLLEKVNTLAMISPITNEEKQKLLEVITLKEKVSTLEDIIDFYSHEVSFNNLRIQ